MFKALCSIMPPKTRLETISCRMCRMNPPYAPYHFSIIMRV
jgi:hypothetical protein